MTKPYLNTATHRLTDLPGVKNPMQCQLCGSAGSMTNGRNLAAWQEHDHNDKPEHRIIILCKGCSDRMIEPHPRLYRQLRPFHPWPGIMDLCIGCKLRDGIACTHPSAKANGGPGIHITFPEPTQGFVDGRNFSGRVVFWAGPPTACAGREERPTNASPANSAQA